MKENRMSIKLADIIIPLMLLFALDFFDLSGMILVLILLLLLFFYAKKIKLDGNAFIMLLFSVSYTLSIFYYEGTSLDGIIKYALAPWGCYILGLNLLKMKKDISSVDVSRLLLVGFFIHGLLNLIASVMQFGMNFNNPFRYAYDFWQRRVISVTTAALYYSPMVFFSIGVLLARNKKKRKIVNIAIIATATFATLLYQNRTLIFAAVIVLFAGIASILFDPKANKNTKSHLFLGISAFLGIFLIVWVTDAAGIKSFLQGTSFYARLTGANGEGQDRTKIWASFIFGEAWKYPFGGNKAVLYNNKPYVHNTWLDIFRKGGVVPFFSFCIFTLSAIKSTFLYAELGSTRNKDYRAVALAMVGIMAMLFVEPVVDANPYIFYLPIIMVGLIKGELNMYRMEALQ